MKVFSFVALALLATPALFADPGTRLIPAGSLVSCSTGDGRISSKNTTVGDPVLCKVQFRRGDFMLPYGSYLGGEFSEYKNPGYFHAGHGWMLLSFDRLYVNNQVIPVDAKVVDVPGYKIGADGRIMGKGHPIRGTIMWMIPVLWPLDLITLPMHGPRPTLKSETTLTLRIMDDIQVPDTQAPQRDPYGLTPRGNQSYAPEPAAPYQDAQQAPEMSYDQQQPAAPEEQVAPPPAVAYAAPAPYYAAPAPYYAAPAPAAFYGGVSVMVAPGVATYGYVPRIYATRPVIAARYAAPGYGVRVGAGVRAGGFAVRGGARR